MKRLTLSPTVRNKGVVIARVHDDANVFRGCVGSESIEDVDRGGTWVVGFIYR